MRHILHVRLHLDGDLDHPLYRPLLEHLQTLTARVQALPPAAADLDLTGALTYWDCDARALAQRIRLQLLALYGVQSTLGLASTRALATMAADHADPGTLTEVGADPQQIADFLRPRPASALHGVGPATAERLARHGLHTVGSVADTLLPTLQRLLGTTVGYQIHQQAHGTDPRSVTSHSPPRSISADRLFEHDEISPDQHRHALLGLVTEIGGRLRTDGKAAGSLTLTVRYADRSTSTRSRVLPEPTASTAPLAETAYRLQRALALQRARVRAISLRAQDIISAENTTEQLAFDPTADKRRRLDAVADRAAAKYGAGALGPAAVFCSRPPRPHSRAGATDWVVPAYGLVEHDAPRAPTDPRLGAGRAGYLGASGIGRPDL